MKTTITRSTEVLAQMRELTLERLQRMPDTLAVAIGSQDFGKNDLLAHVRSGDEIGRQIIDREMEFLRDSARGTIYAGQ